jgi:anti-sigma regulatory factor (Ser/Thr protein kinase)
MSTIKCCSELTSSFSKEFELCVGEALSNCVRHGRGNGPGEINIGFSVLEDFINFQIEDSGTGIPLNIEDRPLDLSSEGGRGIPLIYALSDKVEMFNERHGMSITKYY